MTTDKQHRQAFAAGDLMSTSSFIDTIQPWTVEHLKAYPKAALEILNKRIEEANAAAIPAAPSESVMEAAWAIANHFFQYEMAGGEEEHGPRSLVYPVRMVEKLVAALTQPTTVQPLKDHEIAKLVNDLRDVAKEFHDHQSLRERIAYLVLPIAKPATVQQAEPAGWREALQFYADQSHFAVADDDAWDTVSGEPQNFWCDEAGTATVEVGTVAAMALRGTPLLDEGEPKTAPTAAPGDAG